MGGKKLFVNDHQFARSTIEMAFGGVSRAGDGASMWGPEADQAPTTSTTKLDWLPMPPGLLLYVVVPLVLLALPIALFRVTSGSDVSLVLSLYFWSATMMICWLAAALASSVLFKLCLPLRPPLWAITFFGPILAGLIFHEPIIEILSLTNSHQFGTALRGTPTSITLSWEFFERFFLNLAPGTIIWMMANYAFDRVLGIPRYRYPRKESALQVGKLPTVRSVDVKLPPLVARLNRSEHAQIIAIKSEDHYIRIYTDAGDGLTLLRLRDAIKMARPTTGMQVHRSSWVADRAIKHFRRTGHTGKLLLSNGLEVQVSRSYCHLVEQRIDGMSSPAMGKLGFEGG